MQFRTDEAKSAERNTLQYSSTPILHRLPTPFLAMRIQYFQVNAFTSSPFGGNPAGVCPLESWLPDQLLQQIAAENNFSETAFFTRENDLFKLRWMTPTREVDLCGHATLATAHVLFSELSEPSERLSFTTRSGRLSAVHRGELIELDFPSRPPLVCAATLETLGAALGRTPAEVYKSRDYLAVFYSEAEVAALSPDFELVSKLDCLGLIASAPGNDCDFVSRFFAPQAGVPEDPVTGSAHSTLIPFWSDRLGKKELMARQISKRQGELYCRDLGDRVGIAGRAITYCRGELDVPSPARGLQSAATSFDSKPQDGSRPTHSPIAMD
jgi:PhzF family phenazine biosynthesis protein